MWMFICNYISLSECATETGCPKPCFSLRFPVVYAATEVGIRCSQFLEHLFDETKLPVNTEKMSNFKPSTCSLKIHWIRVFYRKPTNQSTANINPARGCRVTQCRHSWPQGRKVPGSLVLSCYNLSVDKMEVSQNDGWFVRELLKWMIWR